MYPKLGKWGQKAFIQTHSMAVLEFSFHSKHCQREGDNDDIPNVAEIMCLQELHRHDASRSLFMFFSKYRILYVLWCTPMHKAMYSASKPTFPPFKRLSKQSSQNSHPPFGLNKELEECEGLYYDPFCHTQPILRPCQTFALYA